VYNIAKIVNDVKWKWEKNKTCTENCDKIFKNKSALKQGRNI